MLSVPVLKDRLLSQKTSAATATGLGLAGSAAFRESKAANIAYPADANLMTKLASMGKKVISYLLAKTRNIIPRGLRACRKNRRRFF